MTDPDTLALARESFTDLTWSATEIPPGTPYRDEPSVDMPPGVYVFGNPRDWQDTDEGARVVLRVEQALTPDGDGDATVFAHWAAEALGRHSRPTEGVAGPARATTAASHYATAKEFLDMADEFLGSADWGVAITPGQRAELLIAQANVHALLALAEARR